MTRYELWDVEGGNRLGVWDSEADALAFVRELLEENGLALAEDLALGQIDDQDQSHRLIEGVALADRAIAQAA